MGHLNKLRLLNEDEIVMGCKIKIEMDRTVSVPYFISTYARFEHDENLARKVHAKLLESKKYTTSHEVDDYGYPFIKYANLTFWERNQFMKDVVLIVMGVIAGQLLPDIPKLIQSVMIHK
jgi:hypothetical protein